MFIVVCVDVSLQKFKLNIANTVISQDNSSLQSMNTSDLLDLFQISGTSNRHGNKKVGLERYNGNFAEPFYIFSNNPKSFNAFFFLVDMIWHRLMLL